MDNLVAKIIFCIIILIIIAYTYMYYSKTVNIQEIKVNESIQWLYRIVNDVCYQCNITPIYTIKETSGLTYTDKIINKLADTKGIIYLVVWDDKYSRTFNNNTLTYAVLHEIAHIVSPSQNHEPPFDDIESMLLNKAIELSYYDPNVPIESHYATMT